jgi:hypothetical protein
MTARLFDLLRSLFEHHRNCHNGRFSACLQCRMLAREYVFCLRLWYPSEFIDPAIQNAVIEALRKSEEKP